MRALDKLLFLSILLPSASTHAEPIPAPPAPAPPPPHFSNQPQPQPQHPLLPSSHPLPPPPPPPPPPAGGAGQRSLGGNVGAGAGAGGEEEAASAVSPRRRRRLFAVLERAARLVDIAYCVGTTGLAPPFACASRCRDFPSLRLLRTWNTGPLLTDSCGYIAVDHGDGGGGGGGGGGGAGAGGWDRTGEVEREGREGKEIVVAFRGTYSITNTIVDLSTVPQEYVPYPGDGDGDGTKCENCTVHMGFMASWRNAREVVVPTLKAARAKYPGYRVHLLGHSLGGAVAALAALELRLGLGWEDVLVTTYGEPRVGNGQLAAYIDRAFGLTDQEDKDLPFRRVTHVGDPVPLLPLTEWGYRAHAGEVYIAKPSLPPGPEDLRICRGASDPECMAGAETEDWLSWILGSVRLLAVEVKSGWFPARFQLWQLFFAHRDYFWRLGLCVPGGDPADWGREKYNLTLGVGVAEPDETVMGDL